MILPYATECHSLGCFSNNFHQHGSDLPSKSHFIWAIIRSYLKDYNTNTFQGWKTRRTIAWELPPLDEKISTHYLSYCLTCVVDDVINFVSWLWCTTLKIPIWKFEWMEIISTSWKKSFTIEQSFLNYRITRPLYSLYLSNGLRMIVSIEWHSLSLLLGEFENYAICFDKIFVSFIKSPF